MTIQEFLTHWRYEELVRPPLGSLDNIGLDENAKEFLYEVGLPKVEKRELYFDTLRFGLPTLSETLQADYELSPKFASLQPVKRQYALPPEYAHLRVIGYQDFYWLYKPDDRGFFFSYFCVDEKQEGQVVEVRVTPGDEEWSGYTEIRYVNSSILLLAEFIVLLENAAKWHSDNMPSTYDERSSREWDTIVDGISKQFEHLDPKTIQGVDEENFIYPYWWTVKTDIHQYGIG